MRRLLDKRGSVLFLVVVVMSILIIAASATYYIVNNQHSSANVRYSSEQSYQTAVSVSDTVSKYVDGYLKAISLSGNELSDYSDTLIGKMVNLPVGGTSNITSSINLSGNNMGKADITITKKSQKSVAANPKNTAHTFEICTKSDYNGETVVITKVIEIETGPAKYFTRFLTSTGNDNRDVLIGAYKILSDAYFENDYTVLGINGQMAINDSMYSSGTLVDEGIGYNKSKYTEMVVAENFYITTTNGGGAGTDYVSQYAINNAYIGGDFYNGVAEQNKNGKQILSDNLYIMGDYRGYNSAVGSNTNATNVYVNGDCYIKWCTTTYGTFYINGDLYLTNNFNNGTYYVAGDIILVGDNLGNGTYQCGGSLITNGNTCNATVVQGATMSTPFPSTDYAGNDVATKINNSTSKQKYRKWEAENHFDNDLHIANTVSLDDPSFNVLDADGNPTGEVYAEINQNCILYPATSGWNNGKYHTIVVDAGNIVTGKEPMYIKLMPSAGDGNTFAFSTDGSGNASGNFNLLVKGERPVVFIVPETVNFVFNSMSFIGHMDIAKYLTGKSEADLIKDTAIAKNNFCQSSIDSDPLVMGLTTSVTWHAGMADETVSEILSPAVGTSAHNNIFLVTSGNSNTFLFNGESSLFGYVYAPDAYFQTSDTSGRCLAFIGGMIVGSYSYKNGQAVLVYTTPYDYKGKYTNSAVQSPSDIVQELIGSANGTSSSSAATLQGFSTIGYK